MWQAKRTTLLRLIFEKSSRKGYDYPAVCRTEAEASKLLCSCVGFERFFVI